MHVTLDFETRSYCDLPKSGTWAYSEHPTTEVICLCFAIDDGEIQDWRPHGQFGIGSMPLALAEALDAGATFEAHNVAFELSIWLNIMVKRYGWPAIPLPQWRDSMATACYYALPAQLDRLSGALGFGGKDPEGGRLITKYSKLHLKTAKPEIPAVDFQKFVDYCRRDVKLERDISNWLGDLPEAEQVIFTRDLEINLRGIYLDQDGINAATAIVDKRSAQLEAEFRKLTGFGPAQNAKVLAWFHENGLELENLQADYLNDMLEEGDVPRAPTRRAIEIRLEINKASTKKLDAMSRQRGSDGRARFQTRYHGAVTGRNTGSGFQPLNLSRGFDEMEPEQLVRDIMLRDPEWLDACYGDAMDAVAKASRYWITAQGDNRIMAGDFSSVESVILACLAGETWKIEAHRNKAKIYELTADKIYGLPPGTVKKGDPRRQDGKRCFAADTQVLTNKGWRRIVSVRPNDLVWDGQSWVNHGGLVCQGRKHTIQVAGAHMTPDQLIQCGGQWQPALAVASCARTLFLALATGLGSLQSLAGRRDRRVAFSQSGLAVLAAPANTWFRKLTYAGALQQAAQSARGIKPPLGERISSDMPTFAPTTTIADALGRAYLPVLPDASLGGTKTMARAAYSFTSRGLGARQGAALFLRIWCRYRGGIDRSLKWTAFAMKKAISRAISGSPQGRRTQLTSVASGKCNSELRNWKLVYDLANAGPLHRFTILSDLGPIVVHNCELSFGYQGALNAWLKFDPKPIHSDETIIGFCKAWRKEHPATRDFWRNLENAAVRAVEARGLVTVVLPSGIEFEVIDEWLTMRLPNGKRLWYFKPQLRAGMPQWHRPASKPECAAGTCDCKPRAQVTYMAMKEGQWKRVSTYGGKLAENATQAVSREWLEVAKGRAAERGYPIILTIYDEIVAEVPPGFGSVKELEAIMCEPVEWAPGWPVGAGIWEGARFRK